MGVAAVGCAWTIAERQTALSEGHHSRRQHPDAEFYAGLDAHRRLGLTLVQEAILGEWYEVKRKLDLGANPRESDDRGQTALHFAALQGKKMMVDFLLRAGADCSARDTQGRSPCYLAVTAGHELVVHALLTHPLCTSADVNERTAAGATLLHVAASQGSRLMVRQLLQYDAADVNAQDAYGTAPLHKATAFGHDHVVQVLLADGRVDVDAPCGEPTAPAHHGAESGGETALALAAGHTHRQLHTRHVAIARTLLAAGADANKADSRGRTAAHRACAAGNTAIVRLLLGKARVDWGLRDHDGLTALDLAAAGGHEHIVRLIRGTRPTPADKADRKPPSGQGSG